MNAKPTYRQCLDAGMTQREAANARGVCISAASEWAKRNGVRFRPAYITDADIPAAKRDAYLRMTRVERMTQAEAMEALGVRA